MIRPSRQVLRAIHTNTPALGLALDLVLAEPPKLARCIVETDTAGVGVNQVPVRVMPPGAGYDIFGHR